MADAGDEAEILEFEIVGPDGRPTKVRSQLVDGPNPCPFCAGEFSVFETLAGEGYVVHPHPVCDGFTASDCSSYVRAAQEAAEGVNAIGRGSA